jgi:hypothetical protein
MSKKIEFFQSSIKKQMSDTINYPSRTTEEIERDEAISRAEHAKKQAALAQLMDADFDGEEEIVRNAQGLSIITENGRCITYFNNLALCPARNGEIVIPVDPNAYHVELNYPVKYNDVTRVIEWGGAINHGDGFRQFQSDYVSRFAIDKLTFLIKGKQWFFNDELMSDYADYTVSVKQEITDGCFVLIEQFGVIYKIGGIFRGIMRDTQSFASVIINDCAFSLTTYKGGMPRYFCIMDHNLPARPAII